MALFGSGGKDGPLSIAAVHLPRCHRRYSRAPMGHEMMLFAAVHESAFDVVDGSSTGT